MIPIVALWWMAQTPLPGLDELVREALTRQGESHVHLTEYTYDYKSITRKFDENGKRSSETVSEGESYQSSYRNVDVEFRRNGKTHSARGRRNREREAAEAMQRDYERRRREKRAGPREFGATFGRMRMETFATLRNCPLSNLRRETAANGRPAYAIDFGPAPAGTVFDRNDLEHLKRTRGTVWIDVEDRVVSHWKAWSTAAGGQYFEQQSLRLEPRVWAGGRLHVNWNAAPELFGGERNEWIFELTNPKRFSVSVEQRIAEPEKK